MRWWLFGMLALVLAAGAAVAMAAPQIGEPVAEFELAGIDGQRYALSRFRGQIVVLDFWSSQCPISARYEERFKALHAQYTPRGVVFLGIASNDTEPAPEVQQVATERGVPFPILLDPGHAIADRLAAKTTPHVYVIDAEGVLRYQGAVDDDTFPGKASLVSYLAPVLDALLAGQEPPYTTTEPMGCSIKRRR